MGSLENLTTTVIYQTKRCPWCSTNLPIRAIKCVYCKKKVGDLDRKTGMAKKTIQWRSYFTCLVAWITFGVYIWFFFIKK